MNCLEHIEAFVQSFVGKSRQQRANLLLSSENGRRKFADSFLCSIPLDPRYCQIVPVKGPGQFEYILDFLRKHGAPEDCVVWNSSAPEGRVVALEEGLSEIVGWTHHAVISCIPGRLAHYEYDGVNTRYLCLRESPSKTHD